MSKADRYSKMATRTANQAREAAASAKDRQKYQRTIQGMNIESHRHCVICWAPIPIKSEPAVCANNDCVESQTKKESSRKRLTIMMYLFPGIAILLLMIQLAGASG